MKQHVKSLVCELACCNAPAQQKADLAKTTQRQTETVAQFAAFSLVIRFLDSCAL